MNIHHEVTIYSTGQKVLLNLSQAQAISPTNYKTANSIVDYGDETQYYVIETYEELRAALMNRSQL